MKHVYDTDRFKSGVEYLNFTTMNHIHRLYRRVLCLQDFGAYMTARDQFSVESARRIIPDWVGGRSPPCIWPSRYRDPSIPYHMGTVINGVYNRLQRTLVDLALSDLRTQFLAFTGCILPLHNEKRIREYITHRTKSPVKIGWDLIPLFDEQHEDV